MGHYRLLFHLQDGARRPRSGHLVASLRVEFSRVADRQGVVITVLHPSGLKLERDSRPCRWCRRVLGGDTRKDLLQVVHDMAVTTQAK